MSIFRIRPSSLALTVKCPGSVVLQESVTPPPPTEEELEGTAAHWVALRYAAGYARELPVGAEFLSLGRKWLVDLDMVVGATMYARALGGPSSFLRLEDGVKVSRVHETQCGGTPDGWRYFLDAREAWPGAAIPEEFARDPNFVPGRAKLIRVGDYKFGHRYVEAFECFQTSSYLAGVMERLGLNDNDPDLFCELTLVQPRIYHREGPVRSWRCHVSMLRATLNVARSAAREALSDNPRTITNDSCIDCKARHVCKTLHYATDAFIEFSTTAEVVELPPEAMGQELSMIDDAIMRLEARRTGLAAQAESLLRQGKPIAFYHMTPGQSRLAYFENVNVAELVGLGDCIGIDLRKPQTLKETIVTPTQAIALGVDESVMRSYAHRPKPAMKFARDNDLTARKVFSK